MENGINDSKNMHVYLMYKEILQSIFKLLLYYRYYFFISCEKIPQERNKIKNKDVENKNKFLHNYLYHLHLKYNCIFKNAIQKNECKRTLFTLFREIIKEKKM